MEATAIELQPKGHSGTAPSVDGADDRSKQRQSWAALAASCCLLLAGAGGGALLAWWALSFHRSNEQLWMVPVGLVLLGTPIFTGLSLFGGAPAGACRPPDSESTCHATN